VTLHRVSVTVAGRIVAETLSDALEALAPMAVDLHDHDDGSGRWTVAALFTAPPDPGGIALLARLQGAGDLRVERVADRDWVAQVRAELTPVAAGRFLVHGGHDRAAVPPNRIGLEIEAAQAFGTGHHATTQGCLLAIDRLARRGRAFRRMADIGGGTGVLAMAAASVWPLRAVVGDIDPVATETARANVAWNGLAGRVACVTAAGFQHPLLQAGGRYDLVAANILAAPLRRLAPELAAHQSPCGVAILSGLLRRQAAGVLAAYRGWGYRRAEAVEIGEWATLVLRREG
jgi:ribosomal protein L11 methyltransferase